MKKTPIVHTPSIESANIAALDIGSNSFHFVLARVVDDHLQILHSEKYQVMLAYGLDEQNILSDEAIERGLKALAELASSTNALNKDCFRIVATYTLRTAKNAHKFLAKAAEIFPFDIEVISGHEEARLIYQGVAQYCPPNEKRFVIDIGGGSTECVIGKNKQIFCLDSLDIGCVSFARSYFAQGEINHDAFERAILHASLKIEAISARFTHVGWKKVNGTSGTIKTLYQIINVDNELPQPINIQHLYQLQQQLCNFGHIDRIAFKNIKESRQQILCSGLAILIALFEVLSIKEIEYCDYALREGVLFEQYAQRLSGDIHSRTITSLLSRFNVDVEQVGKVTELAQHLFKYVQEAWQLTAKPYLHLLQWAISLHEIGLDINPSGFHKHGKYILENADLPGFNQEQMQAIAWLVGNQRKKIQLAEQYHWFILKPTKLEKLLIILRLSCLMSKQRHLSTLPNIKVSAKNNILSLKFPKNWLSERPLLLADLQLEQQQLKLLAVKLQLKDK